MAEIVEPGVLQPTLKRPKRFNLTDVVIFAVLAVIIIALLVMLFSKLSLRHEVSAARPVADRLVKDITARNASDARSLGDSGFQAKNSTTELQALFTATDQVVKGSPTLERQIVSNSSSADTVYFIYTYDGRNGNSNKYIRVAVTHVDGSKQWHITRIDGSTNESSLIVK